MTVADEAWRAVNRANWDERVAVHLRAPFYDVAALRAGRGRMSPIEEAELGPVAGLRVLHLQCHLGGDSLRLAERGAEVVGLDFSGAAIAAARALAEEMALAGRARFVEADLYDAPGPGGRVVEAGEVGVRGQHVEIVDLVEVEVARLAADRDAALAAAEALDADALEHVLLGVPLVVIALRRRVRVVPDHQSSPAEQCHRVFSLRSRAVSGLIRIGRGVEAGRGERR